MAAKDLDKVPFSIATVSVGTEKTDLIKKLSAISAAHFTGIELGFPDLRSYASAYLSRTIKENDYDSLVQAAVDVKRLAAAYGLNIMMLQPFANFEGWKEGSGEREEAFNRARGWIRIMKAVGTDMLQVGSSDSDGIGGKEDSVRDLKELGEMLAQEGLKLAYEPWCWATISPTWKDCWEMVKAVDMPNVGLCLDTFQIIGGEYADPTKDGGIMTDVDGQHLGQRFAASLEELTQAVPADKIYLLQISDAWLPKTPIGDLAKDRLRPKGRWSKNYRPLPYDGGYLPIQEVAKKVLDTGARSWWSVEVFDGGPEGGEERETDLQAFCERAMKSVQRLLKESGEGKF